MEIWKDIKNFEGLYQISNFGRVKCLEKELKVSHKGYTGIRVQKETIMKLCANNRGYLTVSLRKNNKGHTKCIHRLVAEAFIDNPNNLPCVNHKDENIKNNNLDNLEWCTYQYNANYGHRNQKISEARIGMKFTQEHIKNISQSKKNNVTDEFREKMRQIHLGTHLSDEHKQKISKSLKTKFANKSNQ